MATVRDTVQTKMDEVQALEAAFERFTAQTSSLRTAYLQLKEKTEQINLQLEEANRRLEHKVQQLDEVNNFQSSILESIPVAVVVTDLEGRINTFNSAAEKMWAMPRREALHRSFREVMGEHADLLAGVLAGHYRRETLRRQVGEGEPRIISSSACLVEDSASRPIGAVQIDRDITRLRLLEARLYQQEKLADVGKMAAGLAHEIRKPLNGIKGFASLLERRVKQGPALEHAQHPDAAHLRYIGSIIHATDRLSAMLDRLLDFARPDAPRMGPCDLRSEAESIAEFVRAEDPHRPVEISVQVPHSLQPVRADRDKLRQVLLNLVNNAVEATEGGGQVRISARPETLGDQHMVRLTVSDTGKGIPPGDLRHILVPFYSTKGEGTGLGLSIVKRILELHGTQLDMDSRPGVGTNMHFLLAAYQEEEKQ